MITCKFKVENTVILLIDSGLFENLIIFSLDFSDILESVPLLLGVSCDTFLVLCTTALLPLVERRLRTGCCSSSSSS